MHAKHLTIQFVIIITPLKDSISLMIRHTHPLVIEWHNRPTIQVAKFLLPNMIALFTESVGLFANPFPTWELWCISNFCLSYMFMSWLEFGDHTKDITYTISTSICWPFQRRFKVFSGSLQHFLHHIFWHILRMMIIYL